MRVTKCKMEKLGLGDARQILAMLQGEEIASSRLSPRMANTLREEGLLLSRSNGSRCKYSMAEPMRGACRTFLSQHYGLRCSLEEWVETAGSQSSATESRSSLVEKTGDSKYRKVRTFHGFLVDCYTPIEATLCQRSFLLSPMEGSSVFVNSPEIFEIPEDVVVVGMENAENFRQIRRQRSLFESQLPGKRLLFVCRYPQNSLADLREWLLRIPNRYVHFGDFDLAGIHIYLSEFYAHLGRRSSFLVPSDIASRLSEGNSSLYDRQYAVYKNLEVTDPRLHDLVDMIHHYRKGYEQEGYIGDLPLS